MTILLHCKLYIPGFLFLVCCVFCFPAVCIIVNELIFFHTYWFIHSSTMSNFYLFSCLQYTHVSIWQPTVLPRPYFSTYSSYIWYLQVDVPILTCIFFTFNWLTLTSQMHFVKFHREVASCLLSRSKRKYVPLGMRLLWKYIRNYFLVYHLISYFLLYLQNYKKIWSWNFGFAYRKIWAFIWHPKMYYFRLSPGGWECDWHKVL